MKYQDRIKGLREDKDLTQTQMGKILNASQKQISNWETGRNEPPYETLIAYAKFFKVSTDYILGLSDTPRK